MSMWHDARNIEDVLDEVPDAQCPKCGASVPDFDGFGVLAHIKPAYPDGCGYCSHPAIDDGVCGICSRAGLADRAGRTTSGGGGET